MAHGAPKLSICKKCNQYTLSERFSEYPKCPNCNEVSESTSKDYLMTNYWIGILNFKYPNLNQWIELPEKR